MVTREQTIDIWCREATEIASISVIATVLRLICQRDLPIDLENKIFCSIYELFTKNDDSGHVPQAHGHEPQLAPKSRGRSAGMGR